MGRKKQRKTYTEKMGIKEQIKNQSEIPGTAGKSAYIELLGNKEAIVDGCKGIIEYDEGIIRLNLGDIILKFEGSGLIVETLALPQAIISGNISSIDFTT